MLNGKVPSIHDYSTINRRKNRLNINAEGCFVA